MVNPEDVNPSTPPGDEEADDFSWEDAQEDLEKQREMIRQATAAKEGSSLQQGAAAPGGAAEKRGMNGGMMPPNLEFVLDIPLQVTVELGRTRMMINDLLQLNPGSVIELTKLVGEPLEVLINNKLVARGEVVVVNEKFGIRLTDIISPSERIEQLR